MELYLYNTSQGLKPCYDEDFDEKKKLKIGVTYKAKITLVRNLDFHRKYFALIRTAWEYVNERFQRELFRDNIENFRKGIEVAAGHCDLVFNPRIKEYVEVPRSIAFDKMDNIEFQDLYEKVKNVLFATFLKNIDEDEFMSNLIDF